MFEIATLPPREQSIIASLGNVYFKSNDCAPPTLLQIIGWTPNALNPETMRKNVYVRKLSALDARASIGGGGAWTLDSAHIARIQAEQLTPITRSTATSYIAMFIDKNFIRFGQETIALLHGAPPAYGG